MRSPITFSYRAGNFDWMDTVGDRIRSMRKALGMNQEDLAARLLVDQSTISDIERGGGFSAEILMGLTKALSTDEFAVTAELLMLGHDDVAGPFKYIPVESWLALDPDQRTRLAGRIEQWLED